MPEQEFVEMHRVKVIKEIPPNFLHSKKGECVVGLPYYAQQQNTFGVVWEFFKENPHFKIIQANGSTSRLCKSPDFTITQWTFAGHCEDLGTEPVEVILCPRK